MNTYIKQIVILIFAGAWSMLVEAQLDLDVEIQNLIPADAEPAILDIPPTGADAEAELLPQAAGLLHTVELYAERVNLLEAENGVYHGALEEELIGLGQAFIDLGEYQQALDVFARALHINRINQGLYNLGQLPVLELIIQANTNLNNFEELNKNYSYLLWVNNRNYAANDLHRVPVYLRAANWHLDAYVVTTHPESTHHLVIATNYYSKAADAIEVARGSYDPDLINSLYGIVNANFKLIEPYGFIPNIDSFISGKLNPLLPSNFNPEFDTEDFPRNAYRALEYSPDHISRLLYDEKYSFSLVQNSYKSGRNALLRIIEIHEKNPDLPATSYAYALTHMGDWYLRFYKRNFALAYYEQAYKVLLTTKYSDEAINKVFGHPRSLGVAEIRPEFEFERIKVMSSVDMSDESEQLEVELDYESLKNTKFVLARFKVTKFGAVKNLEILAANPEDNFRFRHMARNTINSTPFRPQVKDGQTIQTENVRVLYRFH